MCEGRPGIECTKTASGRLWFRAKEPRGSDVACRCVLVKTLKKPIKVIKAIPGIWKRNVHGVHEWWSACTGVRPLITNNARVGMFCFSEAAPAGRYSYVTSHWVKGLFRDLREARCTIRGYVSVPLLEVWQLDCQHQIRRHIGFKRHSVQHACKLASTERTVNDSLSPLLHIYCCRSR
eukprot:435513-Pelagomonas_calceolata.AAC.3